jgi:hypothetical protein
MWNSVLRGCAGALICAALAGFSGCGSDNMMTSSNTPSAMVHDPNAAEKAVIDRFSASAAHLMIRSSTNGLPAANAAIDFDSGAPFITEGFGPKDGKPVKYYNFDVQSTAPAPIYVLFREGETEPVSGQLNIVDVVPGDASYNDFWRVTKVTVPKDYVANAVASYAEMQAAGYATTATDTLVNCPIVPDGSTATLRLNGESPALTTGWYKTKVVKYFNFSEHMLAATNGQVPVSPIYVTFNKNPGEMGGGPSSGFKTESDSMQTHNVPATLPSDPGYSPLWDVRVYDNAKFDTVKDLTSAIAAMATPADAKVNCPIVYVMP